MIYKGIVKVNNDPLHQQRIKVFIPDLFSMCVLDEELPWVDRLDAMVGSDDAGSYNIPSIGEMVLVFQINSHEYLWLGGTNTSTDKPQEGDTSAKTVLCKTFAGHTIILNDQVNNESLRLIDRAGQILEFKATSPKTSYKRRGVGTVLDGNNKISTSDVTTYSITLQDLGGNKLSLKEGNVSLEDQSGNIIKIENGAITIQGTGDVNILGGTIKLNNGTGGIHSSTNHPTDFYTGSPLPGSPTEFSN